MSKGAVEEHYKNKKDTPPPVVIHHNFAEHRDAIQENLRNKQLVAMGAIHAEDVDFNGIGPTQEQTQDNRREPHGFMRTTYSKVHGSRIQTMMKADPVPWTNNSAGELKNEEQDNIRVTSKEDHKDLHDDPELNKQDITTSNPMSLKFEILEDGVQSMKLEG